jgi:hypothetical protein
MRKWSRILAGVVAITGWLALVVGAGAETCKLETRRLDDATGAGLGRQPAAYWFQSSNPQTFFMQIGGPQGTVRGAEQEGVPEFSKVITKEPSAYNAQQPFRGVAKLGSQYFGFVFDTATKAEAAEGEAKKEEQGKEDEAKSDTETEEATNPLALLLGAKKQMPTVTFQRLYFDVNHNGDLTDDPVVEATRAQNMSVNYAQSMFPTVGVKIDVDGVPVDYAFTMTVYSYASTDYSYANASLNAAAYREGEMTIDGKKRRVVVVDSNSNGRFDDPSKIDERIRMGDGSVYPTIGDTLYIVDPEATVGNEANPYDLSSNEVSHYVAKQVYLGGRFLDLKVTPAGDQVTLEPSPIPVGYVVNANQGYRAIVYGERGFLKIVGDESGKAPLPVGEWRLASYTIDRSVRAEPTKEGAEPGSLFDAVKQMIGGTPSASQPRINMVSARGKQDSPPVRVTEGQTVELPFGEPFRPVVTLGYQREEKKAWLSMSLVGQGGEVCTNMVVNGTRPGKPKFTISTEKGEVVDTGNFEYG